MPNCADCGYLGVTIKPWNRVFVEATTAQRRSGIGGRWDDAPTEHRESGVTPEVQIACYRQAMPLLQECAGQTTPEVTKAVIQRERPECARFYQLIPFWTAEQHLHEERMELLMDIDRRSQDSMRAIAEQTAKSSAALLEVTKSTHKTNGKYTIAFLILAFISCFQVLTLAWPDGIPAVRRLVGNGEPVSAEARTTPADVAPPTSSNQP